METIQQPTETLPDKTLERNITWEENHLQIIACIKKYILQERRTPSIITIAETTGLSAKTVRKHIKDFSNDPAFEEYTSTFKLMVSDVLREVCAMALRGDIKAARLFLEFMGIVKTNNTINNNIVNTQHNYMQINGIPIDEKLIDKLSIEQCNQIEAILISDPAIKDSLPV